MRLTRVHSEKANNESRLFGMKTPTRKIAYNAAGTQRLAFSMCTKIQATATRQTLEATSAPGAGIEGEGQIPLGIAEFVP